MHAWYDSQTNVTTSGPPARLVRPCDLFFTSPTLTCARLKFWRKFTLGLRSVLVPPTRCSPPGLVTRNRFSALYTLVRLLSVVSDSRPSRHRCRARSVFRITCRIDEFQICILRKMKNEILKFNWINFKSNICYLKFRTTKTVYFTI